jgi:hypothetical protein
MRARDVIAVEAVVRVYVNETQRRTTDSLGSRKRCEIKVAPMRGLENKESDTVCTIGLVLNNHYGRQQRRNKVQTRSEHRILNMVRWYPE